MPTADRSDLMLGRNDICQMLMKRFDVGVNGATQCQNDPTSIFMASNQPIPNQNNNVHQD